MGSGGKFALGEESSEEVHSILQEIAFICDSSIFALAGLIAYVKLQPCLTLANVGWSLLMFVLLHLVRAAVVLLFMPLLSRMGYGLTFKEATILVYGGMRGAVGLSLALMVELNHAIDDKYSNLVNFHVCAVVFLSLVVNGTTCGYLYKWIEVYPTSVYTSNVFTIVGDLVNADVRESFATSHRGPAFVGPGASAAMRLQQLNAVKAIVPDMAEVAMQGELYLLPHLRSLLEEHLAMATTPMPPTTPTPDTAGGGDIEGGDIEGGDIEGGDIEGGDIEGGDIEGGDIEGGDIEGGAASPLSPGHSHDSLSITLPGIALNGEGEGEGEGGGGEGEGENGEGEGGGGEGEGENGEGEGGEGQEHRFETRGVTPLALVDASTGGALRRSTVYCKGGAPLVRVMQSIHSSCHAPTATPGGHSMATQLRGPLHTLPLGSFGGTSGLHKPEDATKIWFHTVLNCMLNSFEEEHAAGCLGYFAITRLTEAVSAATDVVDTLTLDGSNHPLIDPLQVMYASLDFDSAMGNYLEVKMGVFRALSRFGWPGQYIASLWLYFHVEIRLEMLSAMGHAFETIEDFLDKAKAQHEDTDGDSTVDGELRDDLKGRFIASLGVVRDIRRSIAQQLVMIHRECPQSAACAATLLAGETMMHTAIERVVLYAKHGLLGNAMKELMIEKLKRQQARCDCTFPCSSNLTSFEDFLVHREDERSSWRESILFRASDVHTNIDQCI
jgi:hypothetical protein